MPAHKHAALMLQYAQDAAETETPMERWQVNAGNGWQDLPVSKSNAPSWLPNYEYRRKPKTININGHEVPEPLREAPQKGEDVYMPVLGNPDFFFKDRWDNTSVDHTWLKRGLYHLTAEAALAHAKALLSFTEKPDELQAHL